jgi:hypothetical protein
MTLTPPLVALRTGRQEKNPPLPTHSDRILWLCASPEMCDPYAGLLSKFRSTGLFLAMAPPSAYRSQQLAAFSLLLISIDTKLYAETIALVEELRTMTRAPIVLLTLGNSLPWFAEAIEAGADMVVGVTTPDDVIVAHCLALLRRWPTGR